MKYIKRCLIAAFILILLYIVINIGVLIWFWIDPNGFWGVFWFYTLFAGIFYLLHIGLLTFAGIFTGQKGWKRWLYGVLFGVLAMGLMGIELLPVYFISKKLNDKYRHIEKSEEFFRQGKYEEAYNYSKKLYAQSQKKYDTRFWLLRYQFINTELGQEFLKERQYDFKINYAFCLTRLGIQPDKAEAVFMECEEIARKYLSERADYLLLPLGGRSRLYYNRGEIMQSERVYNEILGLIYSLEGQDRNFVVNTMLMRVLHLQQHGDYNKAHQTILQALALYDHQDKTPTSGTYLQLALVGIQSHLLRSEPEHAEKLIKYAEPIAKKRKKRLPYIEFLILKSHWLEAEGRLNDAESLLKEVVSLSQSKSDMVYSKQLTRLAAFYFRQKQYHNALAIFNEGRKETPDNLSEMWLMENQKKGTALLHFALGNNDLALKQMMALNNSVINNIDQYLRVLGAGEKEKYSLKMQAHFSTANALYIAMQDSSLNGHVYNNVLYSKGLAYFSNRYVEQFLERTQNEELKRDLAKIRTNKKKLEEQALTEFPKDNRLNKKKDSLILKERELLDELNSIEGFKPYSVSEITWQDVRNALDSTEVAVEFVHYPVDPLNPDNEQFFALILEKNSLQPKLISLFSVKELKAHIAKPGKLKERINSLYTDERLYNMLWKPLLPYLQNKQKVYLSLSGSLHQIAMPALAIDEPFDVAMLTSTYSLVNSIENEDKILNSMVLMGDLDYEGVSDDSYFIEQKTGSKQRFNRNIDSLLIHQDLPGTKQEIEEITGFLKEKGFSAKVFTGDNGTEQAFRNISSLSPAIVHLATHGFYYPRDNSVVMLDRLFGIGDNMSEINNPMLRSGLLFSGVNSAPSKSKQEDGIMMANEIAAMDFSGVNLVVLSACETGLGDIMGGEGVFGLQRAFKMAGAEKLIVSLWKVPDQATAELMIRFYEYYLSGENIHVALNKAQRAIREQYPEPFYWAGFIAVQ